MSPRGGMSMDSGTVAGNRKVFRRNQTALNGGKNSNGIKEMLKGSLEIKMNNFSVKQAVYKNLRNFRLYFLSFPKSKRGWSKSHRNAQKKQDKETHNSREMSIVF